MPERAYTERRTRGDAWRAAMQEALTRMPRQRPTVERLADAAIALADMESRADRRKLLELRILLERQRDAGATAMRQRLQGSPEWLAGLKVREAALEGLRILEHPHG